MPILSRKRKLCCNSTRLPAKKAAVLPNNKSTKREITPVINLCKKLKTHKATPEIEKDSTKTSKLPAASAKDLKPHAKTAKPSSNSLKSSAATSKPSSTKKSPPKSAESSPIFPVSEVYELLQKKSTSRDVSPEAAISLNAVLEYLASEIIGVALMVSNAKARKGRDNGISKEDLEKGIAGDMELVTLVKRVKPKK